MRIEVTINNPREFKIYKEVTRKGEKVMEWVPMGKSIANLYRYAQVSMAANKRYIEALANAGFKQEIREEKDRVFNSPWNVAADFRVDMSFSAGEIKTMLDDYVNDTGINMDTALISGEIRKFTVRYPYLVSRLCKNIDEYLDKKWTLKGLEDAIKMTLDEKSTLFDDCIKNIENNPEVKALVYELLV